MTKRRHVVFVMRREVVEDQMDALLHRVVFSQQFQHAKSLLRAFAFADITPEPVGMHIVKRQPVPYAMKAGIRRGQPVWFVAAAI